MPLVVGRLVVKIIVKCDIFISMTSSYCCSSLRYLIFSDFQVNKSSVQIFVHGHIVYMTSNIKKLLSLKSCIIQVVHVTWQCQLEFTEMSFFVGDYGAADGFDLMLTVSQPTSEWKNGRII